MRASQLVRDTSAVVRPGRVVICPACDWRYLFPPTGDLPQCPHCRQAELALLAEDARMFPYVRSPELVIPFRPLDGVELSAKIKHFISAIPYPPEDLTVANLRARLQRIFIPAWLVDVQVAAYWQGQTGFEVNTRSYMDKYHESGGWTTIQTEQHELRWEPRLGRLQRIYHNLEAPALESELDLRRALGTWAAERAEPCSAAHLEGALIRLPERLPDDVWVEVEPLVLAAAEQECAQAAGGVKMRDFHWAPRYLHQNWTLMLRPLYTTFYYDEEGQPHTLMLHGETGIVGGVKRSSFKQAWQVAKWFLIVASGMFIVGLALGLWSFIHPQIAQYAIVLMGAGILMGLWGMLSLLQVVLINRNTANEARLN